jgi:predicted DNA-binding transcriptional regulator AlpA
MTIQLLRFRDLKQRRIISNWPTLRVRIDRDGFPPGRMIGPNSRAWTEDEVAAWIESRPTAGPPPRGAARRGRERAEAAIA